MNTVRKAFSRRHIWKTALIAVLIVVFLRLGVWQLSRLEERKAANAVLAAQLAQPAFSVNGLVNSAEWETLADRAVTATGTYDFANQLVLVQQRAQSQLGVHLVTPLQLDGSDAIMLVDRGWVPTVEAAPESIAQFDEPGLVTVTGTLQASERLPSTARTDFDSAEFERDVFQINIPRLQRQMPYDLLPVFLLQAPDADQGPLDQPFRQEPVVDLSNGPHLSYALQWFSFSIIALIFYLGYLQRYG
ncbi:MAG: SURF1 family protein [Anaerolineae bacterium]|nr:SURF1 family protein [Anaerolineae bacterium]MCO5195045.1 SURF1 family protein [Anaerolineae bacterium]